MAELQIKDCVVSFDDADSELVGRYHWCLQRRKGRVYVNGYLHGRRRDGLVYIHRLLTGAGRGMVVDHVNGNPLDNRRDNLRVCTQRENIYNRRAVFSSTGFLGVSYDKARKKWEAALTFQGRRYRLGRFASPALASAAYVAKSRELRGTFSPV